MTKLTKAAIMIFTIGLFALAVLIPTGGIMILAKLVGAPLSWEVACIPFFAAIAVLAPVAISKILIDLSNGGNDERK